ncbi:MAG: primosomal protein N' [Deltaproteobacteria bacterium]|nr:MAG: primosomal protein N' [Deltaproteobacteria bacterium]
MPSLFTYAVPAHLGDVQPGHVVLVPFGRRGALTAYVIECLETPTLAPDKIKPLVRLLDPTPAFDMEQLGFFRWVADYYLTPLGMVIQTALPSTLKAKTLTVLEPTEAGIEALTLHRAVDHEAQVLREIVSRPGLTRKSVQRRLDGEVEDTAVERAVTSLLERGWIAWGERELSEGKGRIQTVELASESMADALRELPRAGKRMRAVLDALDQAGGPIDLRALVAAQGSGARGAITRLEEAGVVRSGEREDHDLLSAAPALGASTPPPLNPAQRRALTSLTAPEAQGAFLLWGVTGSGKTEVFLGAAQHALNLGRQVLVLVPEIGLTPQLVGRFRARFGDAVAVLHSGLTGAERLAQWRRIRAGRASVAVGARSALFAPFQDLGLVVVDEEHDDSYKQDEGVCYNARDLAVVLGRRHRCPVVLASATPSLESWQNAASGRYMRLDLPERATPRPVPQVELVDLRELELLDGQRPLLAPEVAHALTETFRAGGKAIVLYNRRGYATMVQCTSCGATYDCPSCGVTMTLHRRKRTVDCHYCGYSVSYSETCSACQSDALEELGLGTEQVEERLAAYFPQIPIGRMDADTTTVRGAHQRILDAFREGRTRLLVGTQIVAKGHDFPDVHTAVVLNADHGFRLPDFRAAERTYALLLQLAGRAGRGDIPGRVFVQTFRPDHYVLTHLDDLGAFYARELELRRLLRYPPWTRLTLIRVDGTDRRAVVDASRSLARTLRQLVRRGDGNEILGPAPAALARLVGRWRFQLILRGRDLSAYRRWLGACMPHLSARRPGGVRVHWDVDARSLM